MSKAVRVLLSLIISVAICSCLPNDGDEQSTLVIEPTSGSTSAPPTPISQSDDQILKAATVSSPAQTSIPNYRATLQAFTLENQTKLSEDEITALFNLEMNEPDCVLPCWNGITPGVSKIADLETFFGSLGFDQLRLFSDEETAGAWVYSGDLTPEEWRHDFEVSIDAQLNRGKDEVSLVRLTYLARRSTSIGFQLANLLHEFGYPEIVLMDERRQGTEFQLLLAYPAKGISFTLFVETDNSGTMLCIKKPFLQQIHVLLVDPSQDVIDNSPTMKFPQDTYYYSSLSTQEVLKLISQSRCVPLTW